MVCLEEERKDADAVDPERLRAEVLRLRQRNRLLTAVVKLLFLLVRLSGARLDGTRLPAGDAKQSVLDAIAWTRSRIPLVVALRVVGLSFSRYYAWRQRTGTCLLHDSGSCPRTSPTRLTPGELETMKDMATSAAFRHLTVSGLAACARRPGNLFAHRSTWSHLIRIHGWRRPRARVHPATPAVGVRATEPDEYWHVDVTVLRLLDGTRLYLHGVMDNFSRRVLAWKVAARLEPAGTCETLGAAVAGLADRRRRPTVVTDSGVENVNGEVDAFLGQSVLRRVLAQVEIPSSNSVVEAFWRSLKHQWLYLNRLDSLATVEKLVAIYVAQHNSVVPHSAFNGQTPDEMYYGTGAKVPEELAAAQQVARAGRLAANRGVSCASCQPSPAKDATTAGKPTRRGYPRVLQLRTPDS